MCHCKEIEILTSYIQVNHHMGGNNFNEAELNGKELVEGKHW